MYKRLIRPFLFLFSPERVHDAVVGIIKFFFHIPGLKSLILWLYSYRNTRPLKVLGLEFPSRLGLAAGFDKNASFFKEFSAFGFGFIEIGTVTPRPQPGNPKPRSFRLKEDEAIINRMGFNNEGVDAAVERLKSRPSNLIIGGNIGKNTQTSNKDAVKDYEYCFRQLYDHVDYFVVNVSCPNITDMKELQDQEMLEAILSRLVTIRARKTHKKPVLLKISPDLNHQQIDETLSIIKKTGIDGIVATNTTIRRDILKSENKKVERIGKGGLSGKPIGGISTDVIRYIRKRAGKDLPIIGVGGIMSAEDALEKIRAGADLVQVYTGFIYEGPGIVKRILRAIEWESQGQVEVGSGRWRDGEMEG